jgi:hypothetical protein
MVFFVGFLDHIVLWDFPVVLAEHPSSGSLNLVQVNSETIQVNVYEFMLQVLKETSAVVNIKCPLFLPDCIYKM